MPRQQEYDPQEFIDAAEKAQNVKAVARHVGCGARTVYRYMDRYPEVEEAIKSARAEAYSEVVGNIVDAALGREGGGDIDQQWAAKTIAETFGEQINDGLHWSKKTRQEIESRSLGITVLPPEKDPRQIKDSSELEVKDVQALPESDE